MRAKLPLRSGVRMMVSDKATLKVNRICSDVDEGSTVTDFLPAERARGITIQSAAVTFHWPPLSPISDDPIPVIDQLRSLTSHTINLIDTPGHADFTFEVLRSLRILDGAVCILDGVAGVEAQTEKVWQQANRYSIPRIIFVNKLDRDGAAFERTINEIGSRLGGTPALCQIPWWKDGKGRFIGVGDAVNLRGLKWTSGGDGRLISPVSLDELRKLEPAFAEEISRARTALIECLSEHDDAMVDKYLEHNEDYLAISPADIMESLRRCVLKGDGALIPVFTGASFRNIGVQPLLDAVVDLLPEPQERPDPEYTAEGSSGKLGDLCRGLDLASEQPAQLKGRKIHQKRPLKDLYDPQKFDACALAFKVVNDTRRGVLVYIRVYSGTVSRGSTLWNSTLQVPEKAFRLLQMQASDAIEVDSLHAGQIGVIVGLKFARTGDTLISYKGQHPARPPPQPLASLQLRPINVPPPVFFASMEPESLREEKHLQNSLDLLLREDPSLHLSTDEDSGQTLLSGMGELHLEIARDRLFNDFKAKAYMGKIEINYRESIIQFPTSPTVETFEREVNGQNVKASCTISLSEVESSSDPHLSQDSTKVTVHSTDPEATSTLLAFDPLPHLRTGALAALARGPSHGLPIHGIHVSIRISPSDLHIGETTPVSLTGAVRLATTKALRNAAVESGAALLEPVMRVGISVDEACLGAVVHDLASARGGVVESLDGTSDGEDSANHGSKRIDTKSIYAPKDPFGSTVVKGGGEVDGVVRNVVARVPLREMVGYLKRLRSLSKGRGTFVMQFERFDRVSGLREKRILEERQGGRSYD
ncbi:MAG: Ribosome-releasing factor 2, mitochondrial [Vezdaea aestivalis]|nr:MAG: Ribosome-releasing factor 2, mitochondrial [Vezdaea aestivalis]